MRQQKHQDLSQHMKASFSQSEEVFSRSHITMVFDKRFKQIHGFEYKRYLQQKNIFLLIKLMDEVICLIDLFTHFLQNSRCTYFFI